MSYYYYYATSIHIFRSEHFALHTLFSTYGDIPHTYILPSSQYQIPYYVYTCIYTSTKAIFPIPKHLLWLPLATDRSMHELVLFSLSMRQSIIDQKLCTATIMYVNVNSYCTKKTLYIIIVIHGLRRSTPMCRFHTVSVISDFLEECHKQCPSCAPICLADPLSLPSLHIDDVTGN